MLDVEVVNDDILLIDERELADDGVLLLRETVDSVDSELLLKLDAILCVVEDEVDGVLDDCELNDLDEEVDVDEVLLEDGVLDEAEVELDDELVD